jgi:alkylated DNA repair dioxygenase AlkB
MNKMNPPITYESDWIREDIADMLFLTLWNELTWVRHPRVPRREYYVNRLGHSYSYGLEPYARTYESQALHPQLADIWNNVEHKFDMPFETVFLNGYENGSDFLGWHADDSDSMDDTRPIVIVTLGAEREIWFREVPTVHERSPVVTKMKLQHGSLCTMRTGMQDTHQHRIPKGDRDYGPRISLTFRGYVLPQDRADVAAA